MFGKNLNDCLQFKIVLFKWKSKFVLSTSILQEMMKKILYKLHSVSDCFGTNRVQLELIGST